MSNKILIGACFVRQVLRGAYAILPPGQRVLRKIERVIREGMEGVGGQEFRLPSLHPREIWERSGRWSVMGAEMFQFQDRRGADVGLVMTHEEIFAHPAGELRSYKQLAQIWYQFQTKFRDYARPESSLSRVPQVTLKDSSLHAWVWAGCYTAL